MKDKKTKLLAKIRESVDEIDSLINCKTNKKDSDIEIAKSLVIIQKAIRDISKYQYVEDEKTLSARNRIRLFLISNVGKNIDGSILEVVGAIGEWARRVRELRHECGGMTITSGMDTGSGLEKNEYRLENLNIKPTWKRFNAKIFKAVLNRDQHRCTQCGWGPKDGPSQGRRFLEVNHKKQVKEQGKPTLENLESLCNKCHDALGN